MVNKKPSLLGNLSLNNMDNADNLGVVGKKEEFKINKETVLAQVDFSFEVEEGTINYLKNQTIKLHGTMAKAYGDLGQIFSETQEKLANNKNGIFEKWFTALGYAKRSVYNLINRHNYIVQNLHNKELIESLPLTLSYEITSPNCDEDLRRKVLDGKIKNLKEFKEEKSRSNNLITSKVSPSENILDTLKVDISIFDSNVRNFRKMIKTGFGNIEESKQEKIAKEIEEINDKIEKLLKRLN